MHCHICGFDKSESDAASGTTFCVNCGTVLEENTIVSEITFGETAGGKAVLQGSFAGESGRISGGGLFGKNRREGQEQALENGRQKIASLAHAVRLPERYRESAQRYYNLAVVNRFTRGRRTDHVAAVCLYAVCRSEKSSHMLIDFSDVLQVNVFTLGATFLKLCRVLNLILPHVDPSLYISRFAVALDFGDYTQRVAQDAVRIAQRMDRDWIVSGRRPAGICGACLLIAARMNGFRRTVSEMIYIVKVADVTIQKRLKEFNQTESAQLSVRDFRTVWLDKRADPPSFTKNRKQEQKRNGVKRNNEESSSSASTSQKKKKKKSGRKLRLRRKSTIGGDDIVVDKSKSKTPKIHIKSELSESKRQVQKNKKKQGQDQDQDEDDDNDDNVQQLEQDEEMEEVQMIENRMDAILNKEIRKITEDKGKGKAKAEIVNIDEEENDEEKEKDNTQTASKDANNEQDKEINITEEEEEDEEKTQVDKRRSPPLVLANDYSDSDSDDSYESDEEGEEEEEDEEEEADDDLDGPTQVERRKIAGYDELPFEVQKELESIAREKVELEEKALLNPELTEDALEISNDMESWMEDNSILKAAESIATERNGGHKIEKADESEYEDEDDEEQVEERGEERGEDSNPSESKRRVIRDDDVNLSDVDDEEIEAMILTPDEVQLKTKVWYNANKAYLEEMAIKRMVEKDKGINSLTRKGKNNNKKKKQQRASTPAEAAKQLINTRKISKKINHAVFDDMFESQESIAKIKVTDEKKRTLPDELEGPPEMEVVEESGDVPTDPKKSKENAEGSSSNTGAGQVDDDDDDDDDDEEMDLEDMADDERLLREGRARYYGGDDDDVFDYDDYETYDD